MAVIMAACSNAAPMRATRQLWSYDPANDPHSQACPSSKWWPRAAPKGIGPGATADAGARPRPLLTHGSTITAHLRVDHATTPNPDNIRGLSQNDRDALHAQRSERERLILALVSYTDGVAETLARASIEVLIVRPSSVAAPLRYKGRTPASAGCRRRAARHHACRTPMATRVPLLRLAAFRFVRSARSVSVTCRDESTRRSRAPARQALASWTTRRRPRCRRRGFDLTTISTS